MKRHLSPVQDIGTKAERIIVIPKHPEAYKFQCGCGNKRKVAIYRNWVWCASCGTPLYRDWGRLKTHRDFFTNSEYADGVIKSFGLKAPKVKAVKL